MNPLSKGVFKRPRQDLSFLTREILMRKRYNGQSDSEIAKQHGLNRNQISQRCRMLGVPTQVDLGQTKPQRQTGRQWDTDEMWMAPEDVIASAFAGRLFEDEPRAVETRGPRYCGPQLQSYVGCAAEMCAV